MNIVKEMGIKNDVITLVGGGGKTSIMFEIARELKGLNKRVLVTTTTKIYYPSNEQCDQYFDFNDFDVKKINGNIIVICNEALRQDKVLGLDADKIKYLMDLDVFDACIVEGDGSRGISIKAPEDFEPVIPDFTNMVIGVIGADALYKEVNDNNVFRLNRFCEVTGAKVGGLIDEKIVSKLIKTKNGLFKGSPLGARKIVVINKVDDEKRVEACKKIFDLTDCQFAISSFKKDIFEQWR